MTCRGSIGLVEWIEQEGVIDQWFHYRELSLAGGKTWQKLLIVTGLDGRRIHIVIDSRGMTARMLGTHTFWPLGTRQRRVGLWRSETGISCC